MSDAKPMKVGAKVEVVGRGVIGTVAYIGTTLFSSGSTVLLIAKTAIWFIKKKYSCFCDHSIFCSGLSSKKKLLFRKSS